MYSVGGIGSGSRGFCTSIYFILAIRMYKKKKKVCGFSNDEVAGLPRAWTHRKAFNYPSFENAQRPFTLSDRFTCTVCHVSAAPRGDARRALIVMAIHRFKTVCSWRLGVGERRRSCIYAVTPRKYMYASCSAKLATS
jgi:hypothetical protein